MLSVSGAYIAVVAEWLHAQGYGASPLCQRIKQFKPEQTIPVAVAETLLAESCTISGERLAPLKIGRLVKRRHLGSIGHMLAASRTLEQLLNTYVYYEGLFYGQSIANLRRGDEGLELYWPQKDAPENYSRLAISSIASTIEEMGLPRSSISTASFPFRDEKNLRIYLGELGCGEVLFGRELGVQFPASALHLSLNIEESISARQHVVHTLLPELGDIEFAERLYDEVVFALPRRQARLSWIANRLSMSERTLQRRLSPCHDGLRGVINRIRMHLARLYLEDEGMNLLAMSLLLGYSEQSALQLAFKRFYGITPGQWRRKRRG